MKSRGSLRARHRQVGKKQGFKGKELGNGENLKKGRKKSSGGGLKEGEMLPKRGGPRVLRKGVSQTLRQRRKGGASRKRGGKNYNCAANFACQIGGTRGGKSEKWKRKKS